MNRRIERRRRMVEGLIAALVLVIDDYCIDYRVLKMDKKDKYHEDEKTSKCLVPFSPNTPRTKSTVFFTPPYSAGSSSTERAPRIPCFRREEKIPFDLSLEVDELFEEYREDILRKLNDHSMVHTVCKMIFQYLDDLSLCRASHVNQAWHKMIRKEEKNARERVTIFLAKKQGYCERKGKENTGIQKRSISYVLAQSVLENTPPESPPKIFIPNVDSENGQTPLHDKIVYRPCPNCSSPARINDTNSATCGSCTEQFCLYCHKKIDGHSFEACSKLKTTSSQRNKKNKEFITGTKNSKNRLRRLSLQKKKTNR